MPSNVFGRLIVLLPVATVLGCGGGSGGGTSGGVAAVPIDQFATKISQAICDRNFACSPATDLSGHTTQDCNSNDSMLFALAAADITGSQSRGRLSYDGAQMGLCINAIQAMSCAAWKTGLTDANEPAACKAAVVPKVGAGGACQQDNECTTGNCVGADTSASPAVDGQCQAQVGLGASCAGAAVCASDFLCSTTTQTCVAKKVAGETCTTNDECINGCNTTSGQCSAYVGCAVAAADAPTPAALALTLAAAALLLGLRARAESRPRTSRRRLTRRRV